MAAAATIADEANTAGSAAPGGRGALAAAKEHMVELTGRKAEEVAQRAQAAA